MLAQRRLLICHEVQSRRQEKIEHDLTGNTGLSLTSLACFSSPDDAYDSLKWASFLGRNQCKAVLLRLFYHVQREFSPTLHFMTACVTLGLVGKH